MCIILPKTADFCGFWFVYFAGLVCFFRYVVCKQITKKEVKTMAKKKKNLFVAAYYAAINSENGIEKICWALGSEYISESTAYCWIEEEHTEKEIVDMLRKIGYDIPKEFKGSDKILTCED